MLFNCINFCYSTNISILVGNRQFYFLLYFKYGKLKRFFVSDRLQKANRDATNRTAIVESLLIYANRFYQRQFITYEKAAHEVLDRLESLLHAYFNSPDLVELGLPTVHYIGEERYLAPKYLSGLLRTLTGQNTQQHIHDKLIEKVKEKLATTNLTVSEIAYQLGFEHLQSFSKLFKNKTTFSPLAFRTSFN